MLQFRKLKKKQKHTYQTLKKNTFMEPNDNYITSSEKGSSKSVKLDTSYDLTNKNNEYKQIENILLFDVH